MLLINTYIHLSIRPSLPHPSIHSGTAPTPFGISMIDVRKFFSLLVSLRPSAFGTDLQYNLINVTQYMCWILSKPAPPPCRRDLRMFPIFPLRPIQRPGGFRTGRQCRAIKRDLPWQPALAFPSVCEFVQCSCYEAQTDMT